MIKKSIVIMILAFGSLMMFDTGSIYAVYCGDGVREGIEECDKGTGNSDTLADACRTDCTWHTCGDGVRDSDEQCDEGENNSDEIPGRCRTDCTEPRCGDGVLDLSEGEVCDDGNDDPYDGCNDCSQCYVPKDNLALYLNYGETIKICPGTYRITDEDEDGIIIINGAGGTLECSGVTLISVPSPPGNSAQAVSSRAAMKTVKQKSTELKNTMRKTAKSNDTSQSISGLNQAGSSNAIGQAQSIAATYQGTGIVVNDQDVVVMNCTIKGFKQGIKLNATGAVLINNRACGNESDITSGNGQNYGVRNTCGESENWQENGQDGCMSSCN